MFRFVVILIALVMGLALLWERSKLVQMGLEIQDLQTQEKALLQDHHELLIEISSLSSYRRIERIAMTQLGMIRPASHQVVMVLQGRLVNAREKPQSPFGPQQVADLSGPRFGKMIDNLDTGDTKEYIRPAGFAFKK